MTDARLFPGGNSPCSGRAVQEREAPRPPDTGPDVLAGPDAPEFAGVCRDGAGTLLLEAGFPSVGGNSSPAGHSGSPGRPPARRAAAPLYARGEVQRNSQPPRFKLLITDQGCARPRCFQHGPNRSRPVKAPTRGNEKGDVAHVTRSRGRHAGGTVGSRRHGTGSPLARARTRGRTRHARSRLPPGTPLAARRGLAPLSPSPETMSHILAAPETTTRRAQSSLDLGPPLCFQRGDGQGRLREARDNVCDFLPGDGSGGGRRRLISGDAAGLSGARGV